MYVDFDSEQEFTIKLLAALFLNRGNSLADCTKQVFYEYDVSPEIKLLNNIILMHCRYQLLWKKYLLKSP